MDRRSFVRAGLLGALTLVATGAGSPACAETAPMEGGIRDLQTGLVWSGSYWSISGSFWTWGPAANQAANYVVREYDEFGNVTATYDDWRLPSVAELQTAIRNGTLEAMWSPSLRNRVYVWSREERGKRYAWAVEVILDPDGNVLPQQSGRAVLFDKKSGFEVFFVRP